MNYTQDNSHITSKKIGVIGLGYVGLPLAVSFSKKFEVVAFDIDANKIEQLKKGHDYTAEIENIELLKSKNLTYTSSIETLYNCSVLIIAVPTPVDKGNRPNLSPLLSASKMAGQVIKHRKDKTYICYESTVYPGCTEEDCKPVIEEFSGKIHGRDFFLGYSPERINPGDKVHRFETITKVVSGCCEQSLELFSKLYGEVVQAGVYKASCLKVAEAAKVIENTQRDINIALMNELAVIFSKLNIDTLEVLEAASTKWNFLRFFPGLVGGHCIGVDPYYLTYKAETVGYIPKMILSGRGINDSMGNFVALESVKLALRNKPKNNEQYRGLILGFTFKENVPDVRNTRIIDIVKSLRDFNFHLDIFDPIANKEDAFHEYGVELEVGICSDINVYDVIILAVPHSGFDPFLNQFIKSQSSNLIPFVFMDIKSYLSSEQRQKLRQDILYWRL